MRSFASPPPQCHQSPIVAYALSEFAPVLSICFCCCCRRPSLSFIPTDNYSPSTADQSSLAPCVVITDSYSTKPLSRLKKTMAVKGLTLLLVTFAFYNGAVLGATDCTLPWLVDNNPFISKVESISINRCPTFIVGDQSKEYCCYNTDGQVECCNFQEFLVFGLICLIPILIVLLILSSILSCICCLCCPCCAIYKRRQAGSCV